jgi:hypothetical protein
VDTGLWALTLVLAAAVIIVVAVLLIAIIVTARRIDGHAAAIWTVGKNIAANTVQIWQLGATNKVAGQILDTAKGIATVATSIDDRLERLPDRLAGKTGR